MEYQQLLTENPYIAAVIFFGIAIIALASFTDAIEKLHGFSSKVFGRNKQSAPKDPLAEKFELLKREIQSTNIVNNMPVALGRLRSFFIESGLLSSPKFEAFYSKWLTHPAIEIGMPVLVPGFFTRENLTQLIIELNELQI